MVHYRDGRLSLKGSCSITAAEVCGAGGGWGGGGGHGETERQSAVTPLVPPPGLLQASSELLQPTSSGP